MFFRRYMTVLLVFLGASVAFGLINIPQLNAQTERKPLKLISPIEEEKKLIKPNNNMVDNSSDNSKSKNSVSVIQLNDIDPSTVGLINETNEGYPKNLWLGSERYLIEKLVTLLPSNFTSPTLREIFKRLMLSSADLPQTEGDKLSFLELRVIKLESAGFISLASKLAEMAPKNSFNGRFDRFYVSNRLLEGDNQSACQRVEEVFAKGTDDPFWLKHLSLCRIFSGDLDSARLATSLIRELDAEDEAFFNLSNSLIDKEDIAFESLTDPKPLHLAMSRAAKVSLPEDIVSNAPALILKAIAQSPNASMDVRIQAAEKAESLGLVDSDSLRQLYSGILFNSSKIKSIFDSDEGLGSIESQALLFQLSQTQEVAAAKAEALFKAFELGRKNTLYGTVARVNRGSLLSIEPSKDLLWFAKDATIALIINNESERALEWFEIARSLVNSENGTAALTVLDLWPSVQLNGLPWARSAVAPWVDGMLLRKDSMSVQNIERTLAIFEAINEDVPESAWYKLLDINRDVNRFISPEVFSRGFQRAVKSEKLGEAILYALLIFGQNGPANTSAKNMSLIIKGFEKLNLKSEANGIALESMISYLFTENQSLNNELNQAVDGVSNEEVGIIKEDESQIIQENAEN